MAKLSMFLPPFAADYSGAAGVLFGLSSLNVIVDASCCTRNYAVIDEPRWTKSRKSTFGAQLRTLEATLGDDERLLDQTEKAARELGVSCITLIGTPVPALVGMDFEGMAWELEDRCGVPVIGIETNGFDTYELGASRTQLQLAQRFANYGEAGESRRVNVLGATVQDFGSGEALEALTHVVRERGCEFAWNTASAYSPDDVACAASADESVVCSWSGLEAARELEQRFGVPYRVGVPQEALEAMPGAGELLAQVDEEAENVETGAPYSAPADHAEAVGSRNLNGCSPLLVVHDQVIANSIRESLRERGARRPIAVASLFSMDDDLMQPGDFRIRGEIDLIDYAKANPGTVIAGDPLLRRLPHVGGALRWELPHEAVSSDLFMRES